MFINIYISKFTSTNVINHISMQISNNKTSDPVYQKGKVLSIRGYQ